MKTTVSLDGIFLSLYSMFMLLPYYFTSSMTAAVNNIIVILGVLYLLSKKYMPKSFGILLSCYYFLLIAISVYNNTGVAGLHQITSYGKILIYLSVVDNMIERRGESTLIILSRVLGVYILLDFFSLILFPNGLMQEIRVFDIWSSAEDSIWVFGRKNNRMFYYVAEIILLSWRYSVRKNGNRAAVYMIVCISVASAVMERSATSFIVISIVSTAALLFISKKKIKYKINIRFLVLAYLVMATAVVGGQTAAFQSIVESVFNKNMTFSSRTIIWGQVLLLIAQKPLLGWGDMGADATSQLLGNVFFTSAHNQWLNLLLQGGIVLFSVCCALYIAIFRKIERQNNLQIRFLLTIVMFGLFVNMLFEAQFNSIPSNFLFMLIYLFANQGNNIILKGNYSVAGIK